MKKYKINIAAILLPRLSLILIIAAATCMIFINYWPAIVGLGWLFLETFIFLLPGKLLEITFNNDSVSLKFLTLFNTSYKTIKCEDIQYSYDPEVGAKGIKLEEIRLYENGKKIIGFGRGYDGWGTTKVLQIHKELIRLKVSRYK